MQWSLAAALVVSALFLAARTLAGPLTWQVYFRSPVNVESMVGLALTLLLLLRAKPVDVTPTSRGFDAWDALAILLIAALIAAIFWRAAGFYFLSDDFILLKQAKSFLYLRALFATRGGDGSYRPITHLYMHVAYKWAATNPACWHWTEFAIHAANSILVFLVARMLGFSRFSATFAAALFAVHGTRPEAVVWLAGRADLLAAFFVLLGLASFIRFWNRDGGAVWYVISLFSMLLAILSKESAYTFALLLVVFLAANGVLKTRRAINALIPFFAVSAALLVWRIILLGGVGGYQNRTGQSEALSFGVITLVKALILRLTAILFFPINWSHQPNAAFGIVTVLYLATLVWLATARVSRNAFIVPLGFLFSLALPPWSLLLIGPDLQKARVLYLPVLGFCLLLGTAVENLNWKPRWVVAVSILAFNVTALFHNLNAWEEAAQKAKAACSAAAACPNKVIVSGLPGSLNGVYFFANGFEECVEMQRNGDSTQFIDRPQSPCILSWDSRTNELSRELSRLPYDIH